jgi:hypothetical protein
LGSKRNKEVGFSPYPVIVLKADAAIQGHVAAYDLAIASQRRCSQ